MEKHKEIMIKWTKYKNYQQIERLSLTHFSPMNLNAEISGKQNISLTIITKDGYVFGCFDSRQMPYISSTRMFSTGKGNHFIYSLENPKNIPFRLKKRTKLHTQKEFICLYPNSEKEVLFLIANFGYISLKGKGQFMNQYINSNYVSDKGYEYTDLVGKDCFEVDSILIHKWY